MTETIKRESASGIGKAKGCMRKWAWQYLDKVYQPQSAENAVGIAIHKMQEEWLRNGVEPPEEHPYRALHFLARPHLPVPGVATVEARSEFKAHGVNLVAIIDGEYYDDKLWCVHLFDHKVSKWAPKYCLRTHKDYLEDAQFVLYAYYLTHVKYPNSLHLQGGWVYYKVENPSSNASYTPDVYRFSHNFGKEEIREAFLRVVLPTATELVQLRSKSGLRAVEVPGNIEHCDAYGGCYYRTLGCNPMKESAMSMDDLDDLFGETPDKPASPPVAAKPARAKVDKINAPEKATQSTITQTGALLQTGGQQADALRDQYNLDFNQKQTTQTGQQASLKSATSDEFLQGRLFAVYELCRNGDPVRTLEALRPIARDLLK